MSGSIHRVGIHEAKTHLSRLLREVEGGAEIVVMRAGAPVARIVGAAATSSANDSYGLFEGQFELGDDFDADSAELADMFGVPR
jgi:prevent-host-death family protein